MATQKKKLARKRPNDRDAEFRQLELAFKRIGTTREERLNWLLQFANTDLTMLYDAQRTALAYDLSALTRIRSLEKFKENYIESHQGKLPELDDMPRGYFVEFGPVTDELLEETHNEITNGLKQLFSKDGDEAGRWEIPMPTGLFLMRQTPLDAKRSHISLCFDMGTSDLKRQLDSKRAVLYAFSDIIRNGEDLLRACAECHKPFMPVRRQEYCSTACSQKARDRRRKKK